MVETEGASEAMNSSLSLSSYIPLLILYPLLFSAIVEAEAKAFKNIYAFGDSFTDTGNTVSVTGPSGFGHVSNPPYGVTYFHHPTNRYSDGRLVIDFIAQTLSLPFLPPYQFLKGKDFSHGVNFAVAGSTAINHAFFVKNNMTLNVTPQSIQTQLIWFNKFLQNHPQMANFEDTLFWVGEIGVNDYAYKLGSAIPDDTIRKLAISSFSGFLESILNKGAKYVVVQGHPLTGCLPLTMSLASENDRDDIGCVKSVNDQSRAHNIDIVTKIEGLRKKFPQSVIVYADYWNAYRTVMKNMNRFGFREAFKACCGTGEPYNFEVFSVCGMDSVSACVDPSKYINWDGVHLTEAMYKVLSDMFVGGEFTSPPFSYLLDGKQGLIRD